MSKARTNAHSGHTILASGNLSGGTTFVNSIDQSFRNLVLVVERQFNSGQTPLALRFNGDSGTNYRFVELAAGATAATAAANDNAFSFTNSDNATATQARYIHVEIPNYASTVANKFIRYNSRGALQVGVDGFGLYTTGGTAITSLSMIATSGSTWTSGTFTLYGVK